MRAYRATGSSAGIGLVEPEQHTRPTAKHGTRSKYNSGCHCEECTRANREYQRPLQALRRRGVTLTGDDPDAPNKAPHTVKPLAEHGTVARYQSMVDPCRCLGCRLAMAVKNAQHSATRSVLKAWRKMGVEVE